MLEGKKDLSSYLGLHPCSPLFPILRSKCAAMRLKRGGGGIDPGLLLAVDEWNRDVATCLGQAQTFESWVIAFHR